MQTKLQELTDLLYNEGLSKGREEGGQILEAARKEADSIIAAAKAEAQEIKAQAVKDAQETVSKIESSLKMASEQALQATKKDIENIVIAKICDTPVASAISDTEFIKTIIKSVAEKFSSEESSEISLVLPESLKAALGDYVSGETVKALGGGVEASFSKKVTGGFRIGPKDGSYFISLTDETFKSLIGEYLRPEARKFLFGE